MGREPQGTSRDDGGREADLCPGVKFPPAHGASKDLAQAWSGATKGSPAQRPCTGSKVSLGRGAETGHKRPGCTTDSTFSAASWKLGEGGASTAKKVWDHTQIPQPTRLPPRDGDRQGPTSLRKHTAPVSPARTSWRTSHTEGESETSCRRHGRSWG